MTAKTSEMLAQALESVGLDLLAVKARADVYHDFLSMLDLPEMELEKDLRAARDSCPDKHRAEAIEKIRLAHIHDGAFDASKEESDEWAAGPDGQAAYQSLIKGK